MKARNFLFTFLVMVSFQAIAQEADSDKHPKIVFENMVHDFKDIDKGEKVTTVFKFKNEGNAPLEIQNVATSCGCTSAKPEKVLYQPNESGTIPVTFNSDRFTGKITKRVTITTNDTRNPKTVVTIKGNVVVDIVSKPISVFFPKAKLGKESTQEILVSTNKLDKLEISNLKVEPDFLKVELQQVDEKNAKLLLVADGSKFPKDKSRLNGFITYDTNSGSQKSIRTTVTINIEKPIRVRPNSVYFFASKAGKKRETVVKLISTEGNEFQLEDIKSDLTFVDVKMIANDPKEKSLIVTLKEGAPEGKFHGKISMGTSVQEQATLDIPIRGSVIK